MIIFSKDEIRKLRQRIEELSSDIKMLAERQNSQYTDIMLQLKRIEIDSPEADNRSEDDLYEGAEEIVRKMGKASTSFLQRILGIGYSRAAHLMDMLEEKCVIGSAQGSKPREVIPKKTDGVNYVQNS